MELLPPPPFCSSLALQFYVDLRLLNGLLLFILTPTHFLPISDFSLLKIYPNILAI